MKKKLKFISIILLIILISIISLLVMFISYKDTNKNNKVEETQTKIVVKDLKDKNLDNKISTELENNDKTSTRNCSILSKYSENYESVVKWMIETMCENMNENGFIIAKIGDNEEWDEVDGLKEYGSAEKYVTECINNGSDISSLFSTYCPKEYEALDNTYLLGKDSNKEYDEANSTTLYNNLLELYTKKQYEEIVNKIEDLIKDYKLTMPYNYKLCNIYQDAKSSIEYGDNTEAINYGLSFMKLPETYFSNFMKLTTKQKLSLVEDTSSIVPYVNTNINIISVDEIDLNENNWLLTRYSNIVSSETNVVKITYYETNENDTYETYITSNNSKISILSIKYTGNGTCRYNTIEKLNEINN